MSATFNGLDLREVLNEMSDFVRTRVGQAVGQNTSPAPSSEAIESAVLAALAGGPKTADEVLSAIAVASAGTLAVSPAQVHPMLASLAEAGLVAKKNKGDRKVFSISESGQDRLAAAGKASGSESAAGSSEGSAAGSAKNEKPKRSFGFKFANCEPSFLKAASNLAPALSDVAQTGTREQQQRATELLEKTRRELHLILAEG